MCETRPSGKAVADCRRLATADVVQTKDESCCMQVVQLLWGWVSVTCSTCSTWAHHPASTARRQWLVQPTLTATADVSRAVRDGSMGAEHAVRMGAAVFGFGSVSLAVLDWVVSRLLVRRFTEVSLNQTIIKTRSNLLFKTILYSLSWVRIFLNG